MHRDKDGAVHDIQDVTGMVAIPMLRKYVAYARRACHPRLSAEAAELLKNQYVKFRSSVAKGTGAAAATSIPITVRQLEAIVRISEALARMELRDEATTDHVLEAVRLFQVSTYRAATSGLPGESAFGGAKFDDLVQKAERELNTRIGIGQTASTQLLIQFLTDRQFEKAVAMRALEFLVQKNQFKFKKQRKLVERVQ
jgi:DNA replication licensing factor MCM5